MSDCNDRLKAINERLRVVKCTEGTLIQIELLFFDALGILRECNPDAEMKEKLEAFKLIQENQYKQVQNKGLTIKNRTVVIKKFKNAIAISLRDIIHQTH